MSKGLEALKDIKSKPFSWEKLKDSLDTIEKELKALEIIKEKRVQVHILLESNNANEYNESIYVCEGTKYKLTQEEYDLLKEVLYETRRDGK